MPASILSLITSISGIKSSSPPLPSSSISLVPMPLMLSPLSRRISQIWTTSGSFAAFRILVLPLASAAAMSMFSQPVTVILSNIISQPFSPEGA